MEARKDVSKSMSSIVTQVHASKETTDELRELVTKAQLGAKRAMEGGTASEDEWQALRKVMAAQLPKQEGKGEMKLAKRVDAERREMVRAVAKMRNRMKEVGRAMTCGDVGPML